MNINRRNFLRTASALAAASSTILPSIASENGQSVAPDINLNSLRKIFPSNFLWGASTAAHQVEGNNINNDYWFLENLPDTPFKEKSLDACDHYHRYPEDIKLLAQAGLNAYRFSLEWSRIEPVKGHFSKAAIAHYRRMLEACHQFGISPMVTYHHFTSPRWLAAQGGWENAETVALFTNYARIVTEELGDLIPHVCTINELNFSALLDKLNFAPIAKRKDILKQAARANGSDVFSSPPFGDAEQSSRIMIEAHHHAMDQIKSVSKNIKTGLTISMTDFQAIKDGEEKLHQLRHHVEDRFLIEGRSSDFIGVQGYTRALVDQKGFINPPKEARLTQMGYEFWPGALEATIRHAAKIAPDTKLIVTESGIATDKDAERIQYIDQSLAGLHRAISDGINVGGYIHWSLLDNFEWTNGYDPKFGLISVDTKTQKRTIKPSAYHLGGFSKTNSL